MEKKKDKDEHTEESLSYMIATNNTMTMAEVKKIIEAAQQINAMALQNEYYEEKKVKLNK